HAWLRIEADPSLHAAGGSLSFEALLFGLAGILALAVVVGFKTRAAVIGLYVLTASQLARNRLLLTGGEQYLAQFLFVSIFVPLGARCSVDAWLAGRRQARPRSVTSVGTAA